MNEQRWLECPRPEELFDYRPNHWGERKARLLMLVCCRRHPQYLVPEAIRAMVELLTAHYADPHRAEPFDGTRARKCFTELEEHASEYASSTTNGLARGLAFGVIAAAEPVSVKKRLEETYSYLVFSCTHDIANGFPDQEGFEHERKAQADLAREVLGNPFQKLTIKPRWLTENVLLLARRIYREEDFSLMPILADALQDAGCDSEAMLSHCRDPRAPHVRGCWLLDRLIHKRRA
jgi:hypothetical protein